MFTDSHCHLSFPELASQMPAIRSAMAQASVSRALCICTTLEEFPTVHNLALSFDNFWATVGVHPDNEGVREPNVDELSMSGKMIGGHADRGQVRQRRGIAFIARDQLVDQPANGAGTGIHTLARFANAFADPGEIQHVDFHLGPRR